MHGVERLEHEAGGGAGVVRLERERGGVGEGQPIGGIGGRVDDGRHGRGREFEVGVFIGEIRGHAVVAQAAGEEDGAIENGNHGGDVLGAFEAERGGKL